jgi:hypothetical protein
MVAAYQDCLARHDALDKKDSDPIRAQLPLLYGRLINALAAQLKWKQFRYGPVDPAFWLSLGHLYLAAVDAKFAQKPVQLYAGAAETTIEAEYLKVLIFHATSMDKLQPAGDRDCGAPDQLFHALFFPDTRGQAGKRVLGGRRQTLAADQARDNCPR